MKCNSLILCNPITLYIIKILCIVLLVTNRFTSGQQDNKTLMLTLIYSLWYYLNMLIYNNLRIKFRLSILIFILRIHQKVFR